MTTLSIPQWRAWILAIRPRTLTAAVVPVLVGTMLAQLYTHINLSLAIYTLLTALCVQIGTNLVNDALDFKKGADTHERQGPQRATQGGLIPMHSVLTGGYTAFALALLLGLPLVIHGGWPIALLLAISVACGYAYTGGPIPLAYHGLGDLFVFLFFGLAATGAAYYIQTGTLTTEVLLAGTQIGLLATVLIAVNNLRDIKEDAKAHKNTLAVLCGRQFARVEITVAALLPFLLNIFWWHAEQTSAVLLPYLALPLAVRLVVAIWATELHIKYNQLLAWSAGLHLFFGLLLAFSLESG